MGNAKQAKAERANARRLRPYGRLHDLVEIVGYSFGARQDCAAATALLVSTSEHLGITLRPLAVSLFATQLSDDTKGVMGPRASARIPESERGRVENYRREGGDPGHMIAISDSPVPLLLDANLGQLRGFGIQAPDSLILPIDDQNEKGAEWEAELPDLQLIYMPDGNDALWERYERGLSGHAVDAERIASALTRGMSVAQIMTKLSPGA